MRTYPTLGALKDGAMRVPPGTCPSWALSLESSCNPALAPPPQPAWGLAPLAASALSPETLARAVPEAGSSQDPT